MTLPYAPDTGRTHYEGCWRDNGHHKCAVHEVERLKQQNAEYREAMALFGVERCKPCGGTGVQESLDDDHAYDPCDRCAGDQWTTYLEDDVKALHALRKILAQGEEVLCRHCQEQIARLQAQGAE